MIKKRPTAPTSSPETPAALRLKREIMSRLQTHNAVRDFERLVKMGCDTGQLLYHVGLLMSQAEQDSPLFWFREPPRNVRRYLSELKQAARRIRMLEEGPFGAILHYAPAELRGLAERLDGYVEYVEEFRGRLRGKRRPFANDLLKRFVRYVFSATGDYRDREVVALVAAARGASVSRESHKQWRSRQSLGPPPRKPDFTKPPSSRSR